MSFEKVISVVLSVCALVVTSLLLRREFSDITTRSSVSRGSQQLSLEPRLELVAAVGREVSAGGGDVKVIVFTDIECPFCARFHGSIDSLQSRLSRPVGVSYIHFPLSIHKFANQAAAAAECAASQDRFRKHLDLVFAKQDSIGLLTWSTFAQRAGVADIRRFDDCMLSPPSKLIGYGIQAGERLGISGTPTVFINGYRFSRPPNVDQLERAVTHAQQGKSLAEVKFAND